LTTQNLIGNLDDIIVAVKNQIGINLSNYKESFLERRVSFRMMSLSIDNYSEYVKLVSTSFNEAQTLYAQLSINVTKFFRDPDVWNFLRESTIPELLTGSRLTAITAWNCACASGEEAYSTSILLDESLKDHGINYQVFASDVSSKAIEHAKKGIYRNENVVNVSPVQIMKYFEKTPEGEFAVISQIKNKIKFVKADMMKNTGDYFDLIFCRNVLIYYDKSVHELIFKNFFKQLKKGGLLVLGQDESMIGTKGNEFFELIDAKQRIYQKIFNY
jgi:chemotaxis protein methyltransferase CheR